MMKTKLIGTLLGIFMSFPAMASDQAEEAFGGTGLFSALITVIIVLMFVIMILSNSLSNLVASKKQEKTGNSKVKAGLSVLLLLLSTQTFAADGQLNEPLVTVDGPLLWMLVGVIVFELSIVLALISVLRSMLGVFNPVEEVKDPTIFEKWQEQLTATVAIEDEDSILMDHEYDGIMELDNDLPPWWKYGFYLTIVIGIIYMGHYHIFGTGMSSHEEYIAEMKEGAEQVAAYQAIAANSVTESTVTLLKDPSVLSEGREIYMANCRACHGANGEGGVGPNFADSYWIHGGGIKNVFSTAKNGVPEKGMIAWKTQLNPSQLQKVASFILTFEGTNPPNQKAKQGELWVERADSILVDAVIVKDSLQ